jgi:creatinine amidohydrolase
VANRYWGDLTSEEFRALDPQSTVALLPVAAYEQHGPHLAVSCDTVIGEGLLGELIERLPDDLCVLVLPTMAVGKSNEHLRFPGTLTFSAETALRMWVELGECVHRAGLRKLVFVNSHGGNSDLLAVAARELRARLDMLAVVTQWRRFGLPEGLYSSREAAHGIHAGDVETSLMLHLRPDRVRADLVKDFPSRAEAMAGDYAYLRPTGLHAFGWIASDLNPHGAVGEAHLATAAKGQETAQFQVARFIDFLREVVRFPLESLDQSGPDA